MFVTGIRKAHCVFERKFTNDYINLRYKTCTFPYIMCINIRCNICKDMNKGMQKVSNISKYKHQFSYIQAEHKE